MLVRATCSLVWYGRAVHDGEEIDLPDKEATDLIRSGAVEPVAPSIETAAEITSPPRGKRHVRYAESRR